MVCNHVFLKTKNNLITCVNLKNGQMTNVVVQMHIAFFNQKTEIKLSQFLIC